MNQQDPTPLTSTFSELLRNDPVKATVVITWQDGQAYLNGRPIDEGVIELRKDGMTYRSSVPLDLMTERI